MEPETSDEPETPDTPPPRPRGRWWAGGVLAVVAVGIGYAYFRTGEERPAPAVDPAAAEREAVVQVLRSATAATRGGDVRAPGRFFDLPPEHAAAVAALVAARTRFERRRDAVATLVATRFGEAAARPVRSPSVDPALPFEAPDDETPDVTLDGDRAVATFPGRPPVQLRKVEGVWKIGLLADPTPPTAGVSRALSGMRDGFDALTDALDLLEAGVLNGSVTAATVEAAHEQLAAICFVGRPGAERIFTKP